MSRVALRIAAFAVAFRVLSAIVAFFTNVLIPDHQRQFASVFGEMAPFWDAFVRHDSGWYHQIARNGYHYTPGGRDTIAFFPAYPLLMRHVGRLFGPSPSDVYYGGILISWVSFGCALLAIYHLARLETSERRAWRAVLLTAVFPFAFFFGAVYTEALFLAASAGAFYFFRTRRWELGGLCGALATATRANGILMWPALAWLAWQALRPGTTTAASPGQEESGTRERLRAAVGLLLVPVGIGLFSLYCYSLSGNPLEWAATIQRWGYYPGGTPWLSLVRLTYALITRPYSYLLEPAAPFDTLNGVAAIAFVLSVPFVWARLGAPYGLFMATSLWLPLSSGQYEGMGRYCAVLFPFFIWLARISSRAMFLGIVVAFALMYTLCMALFANVYPLF